MRLIADGGTVTAQAGDTVAVVGGSNTIGGGSVAAIGDVALPTPSASAFTIAPGPDGALWFTEVSANKIGRISTGGVVSEFSLPAQSAPGGLVGQRDDAGEDRGRLAGAADEVPAHAGRVVAVVEPGRAVDRRARRDVRRPAFRL